MTRREYPDWLQKPYTQNAHDLAETIGRIANRVEHWHREEQLKVKALAYCRSIATEFGEKELLRGVE